MINFEDFDWLFEAIIASLILPLLCIPIKAKWINFFNRNDVPTIGKIAYRNFLIINSKPIGDLYSKIDKYKQDTLMKYFWIAEGVPVGTLFLLFIFLSCSVISEIRGLNNFFLLKPYYNYLNYGQQDKDLIQILITLNLFSVGSMFILSVVQCILHSIGYLEPKLTEKLSLKKRSKYYYYSIWFSMGLVIGFNATVLFITFWFDNVVIKFISQSLAGLINYFMSLGFIYVYLISIGMSFTFLIVLSSNAKLFSNLFKQKIKDSYISEFPHIRIKTNANDICGKIDEVQNESLIILNDGHLINAIRWDQIITMEIEKALLKEEITMEPLPENVQKKPKWHFWRGK